MTVQAAKTSSSVEQTIAQIPGLMSDLRETFRSGKTFSRTWRMEQLDALGRMLVEREDDLLAALASDLGKSSFEGYATEVGFTHGEIEHAKKHLARWMRPEKVRTSAFALPGRSEVHKDPLGVVLIISPWNYPLQLAIGPLVGAIAAGNCAIVKPSEVAPATSAIIAELVPKYLDPSCIRVVEGGIPETTELLAQRFDYIFYTGSGFVGRIVMRAAAEHLTPVTLELGGKSPTIVDDDVDIDVVARRIAWGKFTNAGQTCIAPDYVLAHASIHDALLERIEAAVHSFFGDDPRTSPDYGRIINEKHHRRLMKLIGSGEVVLGGDADEADRYIAPTVLRDVPPDSPVMSEEVFGPILPVLKIGDVQEAIHFVNDRDKPLALYLFTRDHDVQRRVLRRTSSGGVTINHALYHFSVNDLPFGGVGESGMGAYHGKRSFDTFTHEKAVLKKHPGLDARFLYPPYGGAVRRLLRMLT